MINRLIVCFSILLLGSCAKESFVRELETGETFNSGMHQVYQPELIANMFEISCLKSEGTILLDVNKDGQADLSFHLYEEIPDIDCACCTPPDSSIIVDQFPWVNIRKELTILNTNVKIGVDPEGLPLMLNEGMAMSNLDFSITPQNAILNKKSGSLSSYSNMGNWTFSENQYLPILWTEGPTNTLGWIQIKTNDAFYENHFSILEFYLDR